MARLPLPLVHVVALAIGALSGSSLAAQEKTVELKISSWVPPAHSLTVALETWGKSIQSASSGSIKFALFPAQALGKPQDHYDMIRKGAADVAIINPMFQPGRFPILDAGALPLLATNAGGGSLALDEWYRGYAGKEMADVKFCFALLQNPGTFHSRKRIASPVDVKGLKVRPAHPTIASFISLLGGTNVHSSVAETRQLLEHGGVDAITFSWSSVIQFKIDQAVKFHLDIPLYATPFALVINRTTYDPMSEKQKAVLNDHCNAEWVRRIAPTWEGGDSMSRAELAKRDDRKMHQPAPSEIERWRKASEPLTTQWSASVKKAGWNPADVLAELKTSLSRHEAAIR